ncbi:MAG: hypothetical protein D6797_09375, partial [Bdellovibrio sp.]
MKERHGLPFFIFGILLAFVFGLSAKIFFSSERFWAPVKADIEESSFSYQVQVGQMVVILREGLWWPRLRLRFREIEAFSQSPSCTLPSKIFISQLDVPVLSLFYHKGISSLILDKVDILWAESARCFSFKNQSSLSVSSSQFDQSDHRLSQDTAQVFDVDVWEKNIYTKVRG